MQFGNTMPKTKRLPGDPWISILNSSRQFRLILDQDYVSHF